LDAHGLAGLLREMRRPGGVPEAFRLVLGRQREEGLEAVDGRVNAGANAPTRAGTVASVSSPGSTVSTSAQVRGQLTRPSGLARTE
jgi:hypothetical protein